MEDRPKNKDPYDGIRGPDTPLTPWEEFKKAFHNYIEGEKRFWREMKEIFIRIAKVFAYALIVMIPIVIAVSKNESESSSTATEYTSEDNQEVDDANLITREENKDTINHRKSNFVLQVDTELEKKEKGKEMPKEKSEESTYEEIK